MRHSVTSYTAVVQSSSRGRGVEQAYAVLVEYGGGASAQLDTSDAAAFVAWVTLLSTGKAMYDPEENQLVLTG